MKSRKEIKRLSLYRLKEAKILLRRGYHESAFHLGGYCVELALKARICRNLGVDDLFDSKYLKRFKIHEFDELLMFSGLLGKMENEKKNNSNLFKNWSIICSWSSESRYDTIGHRKKADVERFLNAIEDPTEGFLKWIKRYW